VSALPALRDEFGLESVELARREPSLMLGRLLQVAVAWNARSVHFIIDSNDLEVRIKHGDTPPVAVMQDYLKSAFMLAAALEPSDTRWTLAETRPASATMRADWVSGNACVGICSGAPAITTGSSSFADSVPYRSFSMAAD